MGYKEWRSTNPRDTFISHNLNHCTAYLSTSEDFSSEGPRATQITLIRRALPVIMVLWHFDCWWNSYVWGSNNLQNLWPKKMEASRFIESRLNRDSLDIHSYTSLTKSYFLSLISENMIAYCQFKQSYKPSSPPLQSPDLLPPDKQDAPPVPQDVCHSQPESS